MVCGGIFVRGGHRENADVDYILFVLEFEYREAVYISSSKDKSVLDPGRLDLLDHRHRSS
jgi:hypothetical protein